MPHFNAALSYCKIERWAQVDSNHRPRNYEFPALTTAPWALFKCQVSSIRVSVTLKNLTPDTDSQSGRWDSNPRISAWKADALPLGDSRVRTKFYHNQKRSLCCLSPGTNPFTIRLKHRNPDDLRRYPGMKYPNLFKISAVSAALG